MKTADSMKPAIDMVLALGDHAESAPASKKSAKAVMRTDFADESLLTLLSSNRAFQTAITVFHRIHEYNARARRLPTETSSHHYVHNVELIFQKALAHLHIDCPLALACMLALPQQSAYSSLKVGLASVNNEFHRLCQIAGVGIGASTLWQQKRFSDQLDNLAKNAKWWDQFRLLHISFSEDEFRSNAEHVRSLVGNLLVATQLDVATALEYCRDYNIEGEFLNLFDIMLISL